MVEETEVIGDRRKPPTSGKRTDTFSNLFQVENIKRIFFLLVEISAILAQNVIDVVELTTGYLITEWGDGNLLVPADISDDDVMGLVVEIIKNRETLKNLTNGTSVFEQNQQLLMNTIIEQVYCVVKLKI